MMVITMSDFEIRPGTRGLRLDEIGHVLVPGRGRDAAGLGLSAPSRARVLQARALFTELGLGARDGRIVCSGYKTPADDHGGAWSPQDSPAETFTGVPEADSMRRELLALGLPAESIRVERHSINTVTNFARAEAEGHFGDDRPVAIVAQEAHLIRMLRVVAPRTLRRGYLGIVAPESGAAVYDGRVSRLASRILLFGVTAETPGLVDVIERRIARVWDTASRMGAPTPATPVYGSDGS
jgi:uncharacterized SAM-binding protein YcdF (DUF218 family)